ncbi:MAG: CBS domain-containing protein [Gammaproteobacteria bacterium]
MITVDEMMSTGVQTLKQTDSLAMAKALMDRCDCHHIPITSDDDSLVGLVTHRDVLAATESSLLVETHIDPEGVAIADFMSRDVYSVHPSTNLRKAAMYIRSQRYGCLPVVADDKLVGIITDSDFVNIAVDLLEQLESSEPVDND